MKNYLSIISALNNAECRIIDERGINLPWFALIQIQGYIDSMQFTDLKAVIQSVLTEAEIIRFGTETILIDRARLVPLMEVLSAKIETRMSELSLPKDAKSGGVVVEYKKQTIHLRSARRSWDEGSLATLIRFHNFCEQCLQNNWKLALVMHENVDDLTKIKQ